MSSKTDTVEIPRALYERFVYLGLIDESGTRDHNVGKSDYSKHTIQTWSIWLDYNLDPWRGDIIKRTLREKEGTPEEEDIDKIIHICQEIKRQIHSKDDNRGEE